MAKRKPFANDNIQVMDHQAFRIDDSTKETWRAVADEAAHDKLDAIAAALGAASNTVATIYNVSIISAGVEQSQALPANTKKFLIRSRNKGQVRLAYSSGGTNTTYLTLPLGTSFVDDAFYTAQTVYFQSSKPGDIIEIVAYA